MSAIEIAKGRYATYQAPWARCLRAHRSSESTTQARFSIASLRHVTSDSSYRSEGV